MRAVAAKAGQHRTSTGATVLVSAAPSQVRLSSGAPLPDGELALYYLLEDSSPKPTSPTSPLLQSAKTNRTQLATKQSSQQRGLACVQQKEKELPGSPGPGPIENYEIQPKQEQDANKENLRMGLHIPRFNMIEARQSDCPSSEISIFCHVPDMTCVLQRALVLAVMGKLTKEAYKFVVRDATSSVNPALSSELTSCFFAGIRPGELDYSSAECKQR